ncbi:hypothetical protein HDU97_007271 [Phlyctochytrium planicorne]|nr:hypothetical protein HDU97_007271 [Phlyctochytrium planicorne]
MLLLQVGQCGIQVGQAICKELQASSLEGKSRNLFLTQQLIVDTERKTWSKVLKTSTSKEPPTFVDCGATGRGNNWAYGYCDDQGVEAVLEGYRITLERSNVTDSECMLIHSIAGGTGSGLGSRILEELRSECPKSTLLTCSIIPFVNGETALQHYNTVLSLGCMQNFADQTFLFSNDLIMSSVLKQYGAHNHSGGRDVKPVFSARKREDDRVSVNDLNDYIAQAISGLMLPTTPVRQLDSGALDYMGFEEIEI